MLGPELLLQAGNEILGDVGRLLLHSLGVDALRDDVLEVRRELLRRDLRGLVVVLQPWNSLGRQRRSHLVDAPSLVPVVSPDDVRALPDLLDVRVLLLELVLSLVQVNDALVVLGETLLAPHVNDLEPEARHLLELLAAGAPDGCRLAPLRRRSSHGLGEPHVAQEPHRELGRPYSLAIVQDVLAGCPAMLQGHDLLEQGVSPRDVQTHHDLLIGP